MGWAIIQRQASKRYPTRPASGGSLDPTPRPLRPRRKRSGEVETALTAPVPAFTTPVTRTHSGWEDAISTPPPSASVIITWIAPHETAVMVTRPDAYYVRRPRLLHDEQQRWSMGYHCRTTCHPDLDTKPARTTLRSKTRSLSFSSFLHVKAPPLNI